MKLLEIQCREMIMILVYYGRRRNCRSKGNVPRLHTILTI
ncbi:hypothetical protein BCAH1134_C0476 (plasmid) [Bacillus cereus AH1134]|nr:hypothetical protein BCAH1134_C0476 [Bacillus cereus AH1134]